MERFAEFLCRDERESGTIETYLRSLRGFAEWAAGWKTTKELLSAWKRGCPAWNTGMLAAIRASAGTAWHC